MKLKRHKFPILFLVIAVFFSAMFCCCLTKFVQADEQVPTCHQTTHDNESSQNKQECDCDQSFAILEKDVTKSAPIQIVSLLSIESQIGYEYHSTVVKMEYHPPTMIYDTSPLYIKHSVLRI